MRLSFTVAMIMLPALCAAQVVDKPQSTAPITMASVAEAREVLKEITGKPAVNGQYLDARTIKISTGKIKDIYATPDHFSVDIDGVGSYSCAIKGDPYVIGGPGEYYVTFNFNGERVCNVFVELKGNKADGSRLMNALYTLKRWALGELK